MAAFYRGSCRKWENDGCCQEHKVTAAAAAAAAAPVSALRTRVCERSL